MFQMFRPQMFPLDPRCSHCKMNENMVWTDSQDHGEDEILHTSKTMLFHKTTRFISEILTLFRVPPQLFYTLLLCRASVSLTSLTADARLEAEHDKSDRG